MKRSKRYKASSDVIKAEAVSLPEGLIAVKQNPVKFDAGIEVHIKLGIDPTKSEQIVRGTVSLPHGTGKTKKVVAFVNESKVAEAKAAGADMIGDDALIAEIKESGKCDFEVAVATPDMMKKLGPIAKTLGQQGLMPSPKTETVGDDVKAMITDMKGGKVAFRSDDGGNLHLLIGRVSFDDTKLMENLMTFVDAAKKLRPSDAKGEFMRTITLSSSMGPGVQIVIE